MLLRKMSKMILDTEKDIVPNWFQKEDLEDLTNLEISDKEFLEFKEFVEDSNLADSISEDIRQLWLDFKRKGD